MACGDPAATTGSSTSPPSLISTPPPHMEDLSARLSGKTVFSNLDLRKGYYQVPVSPKDFEKTAVITPFGLYEFLWMPFGVRNRVHQFFEIEIVNPPMLRQS